VPRAQTIRRWLWRLNGGVALLVLGAWGWALFGTVDKAPPIPVELPAGPPMTEPPRASVAWEEIVALSRPWIGPPRSARGQAPATPPTEVHDGRLPLAALEVVCHVADPSEPDVVLLKSKDPAHPETYVLQEGKPDGGIAIERIVREAGAVKITVRRDEETFTYELPRALDFDPRGICRVVPRPQSQGEGQGRSSATPSDSTSDATARTDVKLVPFYGSRGQLLGGRVTGVRPGSRLAQAGLRRGDVEGLHRVEVAELQP
jgi:hypothetical protein